MASPLASGGGLVGSGNRLNDKHPNFICERPAGFRGRGILDLDMESFCTAPAIIKLAIQVHNTYVHIYIR
jgi:hypothetical protein